RRPQALDGEAGEGIEQHGQPRGDHQTAHDAQRKKAEQRQSQAPAGEGPGNIGGESPRSDHQKDRRAEQSQSTLHGSQRTTILRIANINALRRRCPRPWPRSPRHNLPDSDTGRAPGADTTASSGGAGPLRYTHGTMNAREILDLFGTFISSYSADEKDAISQFAESTISALLDA